MCSPVSVPNFNELIFQLIFREEFKNASLHSALQLARPTGYAFRWNEVPCLAYLTRQILTKSLEQKKLNQTNVPCPPRLAFSAMSDPYFKVIFSSGEVLAEMENVPAIELKSIQPDGIFGFAFMYYANGKRIFEFMTLRMNRNQQLSDFSFVLERKPGHNCKMDNIEGTYRKLACNGEFEIRPLTADEKVQAAQIGPGW